MGKDRLDASRILPNGTATNGAKPPVVRLTNRRYLKQLRRLQIELVKLQEWVKHKGLKVVVIFEGRDGAGKGGAIKRIAECLNPRICRIVALGTPTDREKTQWYFSGMSPNCPPPVRWSCWIGAGITAQGSSA